MSVFGSSRLLARLLVGLAGLRGSCFVELWGEELQVVSGFGFRV